MTGLNHALTGTAIALAVQQPLLAAPLAFLSHFLLDVIPHFGGTPIYEYGHKYFPYLIAADGVATVTAVAFICTLVPSLAALVVLCVLCAMLPDILLFAYYAQGRPNTWFHRHHLGMQWYERPPGIIVEAAYAIFITSLITAQL